MHSFSLSKKERLSGHKSIAELFAEGKSFFAYPFKVVYLQAVLPVPVQVGFSVSKKTFKRAVKRNKLKRRMRESYRLNKTHLYEIVNKNNSQLFVMFIYTGTEMKDYWAIEKGMKKAIAQLTENIY